jgi:hypothetical protein
MTLTMIFMTIPLQTVCAAMIGTETVLTTTQTQNARENLIRFLEREDVEAAMTVQGVNWLEARARVGSLSDAEVMRIAEKMDQSSHLLSTKNKNNMAIRRIPLLLCGGLLLICLTGCAGLKKWEMLQKAGELPPRFELKTVPFFPQKAYQCGPASLATALNW